jgi:hypothetical protein
MARVVIAFPPFYLLNVSLDVAGKEHRSRFVVEGQVAGAKAYFSFVAFGGPAKAVPLLQSMFEMSRSANSLDARAIAFQLTYSQNTRTLTTLP